MFIKNPTQGLDMELRQVESFLSFANMPSRHEASTGEGHSIQLQTLLF
jgi:hypothetical protein